MDVAVVMLTNAVDFVSVVVAADVVVVEAVVVGGKKMRLPNTPLESPSCINDDQTTT